MTLNMASRLEEYHSIISGAGGGHFQQQQSSPTFFHQQQQQMTRQTTNDGSISTSTAAGSAEAFSSYESFTTGGENVNNNNNNNQCTKETIHSGQFMVSHFEAEAQDEEDDSEIKMPDPDEVTLEKVQIINPCTDVQLYVPQKVTIDTSGSTIVTSHLEIETSLTKLFKCMNLAYSQKLTSPKWNHFKGIRLRWKDKIRLNNVIWRCWHMQFILKRRTPVCQFASPLDVDIHSNPQSVVLEGKYWKRQLSVIKAEYRKWRRNFKIKAIGNLICDTKSELDILDWSPLTNDRSLTLSDDWTTDTLFSAINGPFPFPDPREIARGAGIADFIQPSLGPLQPNIDDLDITIQDLLQSSRLPPVPEEDILKGVDYEFPAIMGSESIDSANIVDVTNSTGTQPSNITDNIEDSSMLELNTPITPLQFSDKLFPNDVSMQDSNLEDNGNTIAQNANTNLDLLANVQYTASSSSATNTLVGSSTDQIMSHNSLSQAKGNTSSINFALSNANQYTNTIDNMNANQIGSNLGGKGIMKGRISKNIFRPFRRREPHNYDKAQPTHHQTSIYQQIIAEQQLQPDLQQTQLGQSLQYSQAFANTNSLGSIGNYSLQNSNILPNLIQSTNVKSFSLPQNLSSISKLSSSQPEILQILNINTNTGNAQDQQSYKQQLFHQANSNINAYKPYTSAPNVIKKSSPNTVSYINISSRNIQQQISPPSHSQIGVQQTIFVQPNDQQQLQSSQPNVPNKEMYRSNSLPLNTKLLKIESKEETFAVPKYNVKSSRSRTRSHSIQQNPVTAINTGPPSLQTAASEPMLTSTLAQLLTTSGSKQMTNKISSSANVITSSSHSLPPSGFSSSGFTSQPTTIHSPTGQNMPGNSISMINQNPSTNKSVSFSSCTQHPPSMLSLSPDTFTDQDSPLSPSRSSGKRDNQRRAGHIHAEQKRRYNIKNGFDMLHSLIPQLQQNPNAKLSKAAMLQKGSEYIRQLRSERKLLNEKMDNLRKERDNLNNSLTHLHSVLPANGAPVSRQRTERVKQLYNQYVRYRTMQNWKFWILGLILEPMLSSFTNTVSMASIDELYRTALLWVDQHCSLIELRPAVSNKLRYLSMTTDILSDPPSTLQEEVLKAINNPNENHLNLNST